MTKETVRYGEAIEAFMRDAGRPVTATEIADAVDMTRQGAYAWVQRNMDRLREAGKGRNGATTYEVVPESEIAGGKVGGLPVTGHVRQRGDGALVAASGRIGSNAATLHPGATLTVQSVALADGGGLDVVLATDTGDRIAIVLDQ